LLFIPFRALIALSLSDEQYSQIVVIPLIAGVLIYSDRKRIFRNADYCPGVGIPMVLAGVTICNIQRIAPSFSGNLNILSVSTFGGLVVVMADFILCFGVAAFCRAAFAWGFLMLTIPVPAPAMKTLVRSLQNGSASCSAILFRLIHLPALRQDLRFALPGFDIEIAEQCSGIRSSIALCIANVLAGHLFLHTWWRKMLLVLITIPLVIFKNALRIVAICWLGVYVNQGFLHGKLHRYSGLPFSLVELAVIAPLVIRWHLSDTSGRQRME
jgi:exosortase